MTVIVLALVLIGIALAVFTYALVYRSPRAVTYTGTANVEHTPTTLPGWLDRTVGNITGWRFAVTLARRNPEQSAVERAMVQSGNPWSITVPQYYALVLLFAAVFGAGFAIAFAAVGAVFAAVLALPALPLIGGIVGGLVGAAAGSRYPLSHMRSRANKHQREVVKHLAEAMDLFSMATASGMSVPQAMTTTSTYLLEGPLQEEVQHVVSDIAKNHTFTEAVDGMQTRVPTTRMRTFVRVLRSANLDGVDRTDTLRREAAEVREDQARLMEERSGIVQMIFITAIIGLLLPLLVIPFAIPMGQAFLANWGSM